MRRHCATVTLRAASQPHAVACNFAHVRVRGFKSLRSPQLFSSSKPRSTTGVVGG